MKHELHKHANILGEAITPQQKRTINAFMEVNQPANAGSYAPQGGEVFGILKNMKETFEANLASSQQEEKDNQKAYVDLKSAKQEEISAGQEQLQTKTNELGVTDEKLANDKQDLEDTQNSLAADKKFLANLKEKCAMFDQEFEERQKTRQEEIGAVSKAMSVLSDDDARDLFTKTFNPAAFLQTGSFLSTSERRNKAYDVLITAAKKAQNPQ